MRVVARIAQWGRNFRSIRIKVTRLTAAGLFLAALGSGTLKALDWIGRGQVLSDVIGWIGSLGPWIFGLLGLCVLCVSEWPRLAARFGWGHSPSFAIEPRSATLSEKSWARIGVKNLTRKMLPKCTVRVSSWELPVFAELDTETRSLVDDSMHQHFAPRRLPWMDDEAEEFDLPADGSFYYVNVAFLEYGGNRCILAKGGQGWTGELGFEITISSPDENAKTLRKKLTATCDPGKRDVSGISTISTIAMYPIVLQEVGDAPIKRLTQRILSLPPSKAP